MWTEQLNQSFLAAKELASKPIRIAEPRPDDQLQTYSDYAEDTKAVGGRLVIIRKKDDGTTHELIGGFFSAVLTKHKRNRLPCEGEACGIRLVWNIFHII